MTIPDLLNRDPFPEIMGWIIGLWCLLFVIVGGLQKPTRRVSSVWALGIVILLTVDLTYESGVKGFVVAVLVSVVGIVCTNAK
jgi:hypothetical protein